LRRDIFRNPNNFRRFICHIFDIILLGRESGDFTLPRGARF
jgi:hypothetical protein